ncbi:DUF4352 domain-containing protein [Streptomyces achromogenes]|uniref:DUF4352 domain-containing protein n=1 Tax=Streptomyces achromogenes TaxID=67255 RepID=UPI00370078DE
MRAYIRAAVPAVLLSAVVVLTGCSSGSDDTAAPSKALATQKAAQTPAEAPSSAAPSSSPAPVLSVGQTGTYDVGETDDTGDNYRVTSKMSVTVVSAQYVTPAEVGAVAKPRGQYVELTLTVRNVGKAPSDFHASAIGKMQWEDEQTAAQDATTTVSTDGPDLDTTYKPGQGVTGKLVLDVGRRGGVVSYMGSEDPDAGAVFKVKLPK